MQRPGEDEVRAGGARAGRARGRRPLAIAAATLAVVAAGVGAFVVLGGADETDGGVVLLAADEVREPAFYDDLGPATVGEPADDGVEADAFAPLAEPVAVAERGVRGTAEGLHTAHRDEPLCDVERAVEHLAQPEGTEAEARAETWFGAVGRHVDNRNSWAQDLTAVQLRHDTRVQGHDLVDGEAVPFPAVLQAGTAVLVDRFGVPRLRCADGMPLAEPATGDAGEADTDGAWAGFDPVAVVVVELGSEVEELLVHDPATGELFERDLGSGGDDDHDHRAPEAPASCDDCPSLDVTLALSDGAQAWLERTKGPVENRTTPDGLHWSSGEAEPGPYAVAVRARAYVHHTTDDPAEVANAILFDDPALEGEEFFAELSPGQFDVWDIWVCVPGEATLTIAIDEVVAETVSQPLGCGTDDAWTYEFTVP